MQERRHHKRVAVELSGSLVVGDRVLDVVVKDMSACGALIEVDERLPPGVPLTLRIDKLGEFDCQAMWSREVLLVGLGFFEAHEGVYEFLERPFGTVSAPSRVTD